MTAVVRGGSAVLGLMASGVLVFGFCENRTQATYSYLFAFVYVWTILFGALFLLMIGNASNATWFAPLRRQCERIVGALPILVLLVLPLLVFARDLYPWMHWQRMPEFAQELVKQKLFWLNRPFFICRSIAYVAAFVLFAERLRALSIEQDKQATGDATHEALVRWSIAGLVLLGFTMTFASWDWVMTLEPTWYSNLYGVYLFSGGFLSALSLTGILVILARRRGALPASVSSQHFHAIGKLQLTMVIFWAYIGWCHVLQQWISDLPAEVSWYLNRWYHGWQWEGWALVVLHFALPFLFLLFRATKRNPNAFTAVSTWLLLAHAIDVHYLVLPALHTRRYVWHWLDCAAFIAVSSLTLLFGSMRGHQLAAMPMKDPLLARGLAYQSHS